MTGYEIQVRGALDARAKAHVKGAKEALENLSAVEFGPAMRQGVRVEDFVNRLLAGDDAARYEAEVRKALEAKKNSPGAVKALARPNFSESIREAMLAGVSVESCAATLLASEV